MTWRGRRGGSPSRWGLGPLLAIACIAAAPAAAGEAGAGGEDQAAEEAPGFVTGFTVHGEVEAGGEVLGTKGNTSKFEEYRDIPESAVLPDGRLHLDNPRYNYFVDVYAEDVAQEDQRYTVRFGQAGRYDVEFRWDEIPHEFSNTGRTLETQPDPGVYAIANDIQRELQADPSLLAGFLAAAHSVGLRLRQDTGQFRFRYSPMPEWEFHAAYAVERQDGTRPIGTSSSFFNGADVIELPGSLDYLTHNVDVGAGYGRTGWRLEVGYLGSRFVNDVPTLVWDNPLRATDTVGGFQRGRLALAPDNQAHAVKARGALALPLRTQALATLRYGWLFQDEDFLPFTTNQALVGVPRLPGSSLDGDFRTTVADVSVTSRALDPVTVTTRYRFYDLDNRSRSLVFGDYVEADTQLAGVARRNLLYSYDRQTASTALGWRIRQRAALGLTYGWERLHREHREVRTTDEHRAGPSLDLTPWAWLLLRAAYEHGIRTTSGYDPSAPTASFPSGDPVERPRLQLLRKFDEAHRQRDQVDLLAQVSPVEQITLAGAFVLGADDFDRSKYGLLDDDHQSYSLDLSWTPVSRLSLGTGYTREVYRYRMGSRYRPTVLVDGRQRGVDDPANDWRTRGRDTVETVGARLQAALIPERLTFDLSYSWSAAVGRLHASSAPGGDPAGDAVDLPNVKNRLQQVATGLGYRVGGGFWARLGYAFEKYEETDFAQDVMRPYMGGVDPGARESAFLGVRVPGYVAHIGTFTLAYRF
jgi:MtrB/PioB family decaheme-associated outer membrane protein